MQRKILIAYEKDGIKAGQMDITERNQTQIQKVKTVLRMIGRTWKIKDSS